MIDYRRAISVLCILVLGLVLPLQSIAQTEKDEPGNNAYQAKIGVLEQAGAADTANQAVEVAGAGYASLSGDGIRAGDFEGKKDVLVWEGASGQVDYDITLPETGFYNIYVEYMDAGVYPETLERGLTVNGETPDAGINTFVLGQHYRYDSYPFALDADGNEKRPGQIAVKAWYMEPIVDKTGMTSAPLKFYMKQGTNRISLTGVRGALAIGKIIVKSPDSIPSYTEYEASMKSVSASAPTGFLHLVEGENTSEVSSPGIQLFSISEAGISPETYGKRKYNAIGGLSWRWPQQWVEWQVDVPEDGTYQIGIKYEQADNNALSSYRTVEIDGKVPFAEMASVAFPYSTSLQNKVLGNEEPYGFRLAKGKHRIRLTVTSAPYLDVYQSLWQTSEAIGKLDVEIKKIIGVTSDKQIDLFKQYDLKKYMPELDKQLNGLAAGIREQIASLSRLTGSAESGFDMLLAEAERLEDYAERPDDIPKSVDSLTRVEANVANFAASLAFQPLLVDTVMVKSADADFPNADAGFWQAIGFFFNSFFASFTNDYDTKKGAEGTIEVWVQRNRDYVDLMQQYANEYFTPLTGYKVNVNYIPGPDVLVLANAASKQPDVVTGIGMDTPFNFALRNAVVNMNEYPEYAELSKLVPPGTLIPFRYNGGDYALPEEATMNMMYYREDVLNQYRIPVPQTWEDVKKIIPTLQQNNLNFWAPQGDWLTFFYQKGVDIYTQNGADVGFDTPQGFAAFKYMTDLYVKYNLPQVITSFYQHFRQGDVPIGISSINDYVLLRLAAPELSTYWKIAPIPGTMDASGTNVRWHGGDVRGVMMMKTTKERQDKAWAFVKWWMSTETQAQFANELENNYGLEFRWYSANSEVVKRTPWAPQDKEVMLEQLKWFKGIPYVPGGSYMTGRELANAWTGTVIDKGNYREKLEQALDSIRREMARYRREYGLSGGSQ